MPNPSLSKVSLIWIITMANSSSNLHLRNILFNFLLLPTISYRRVPSSSKIRTMLMMCCLLKPDSCRTVRFLVRWAIRWMLRKRCRIRIIQCSPVPIWTFLMFRWIQDKLRLNLPPIRRWECPKMGRTDFSSIRIWTRELRSSYLKRSTPISNSLIVKMKGSLKANLILLLVL